MHTSGTADPFEVRMERRAKWRNWVVNSLFILGFAVIGWMIVAPAHYKPAMNSTMAMAVVISGGSLFGIALAIQIFGSRRNRRLRAQHTPASDTAQTPKE